MMVQGYLEIDHQSMTDDEYESFLRIMSEHTIHFYLIDASDTEYYFCILRDNTKVDALLRMVADRNPTLNGLWGKDGFPYGRTRVTTYDDDGLATTTISGDPIYPFDLTIHLSHTPDDVVYNEDGDVLSTTAATIVKPLHGFAGWSPPTEY